MALAQYLHGSYFAIENPIRLIDRWVNSYCHQISVELNGKQLLVKLTKRAEQALANKSGPLIVEMQLYFSCVVKKRVLFHGQTDLNTLAIDDKLRITFRSIEAARCDPVEFARYYPVGRVLETLATSKMIPSWVKIDSRQGQWEGEFGYHS